MTSPTPKSPPSRVCAEGLAPTRNTAATTPNNAMKAGSSIDCDMAAENG